MLDSIRSPTLYVNGGILYMAQDHRIRQKGNLRA